MTATAEVIAQMNAPGKAKRDVLGAIGITSPQAALGVSEDVWEDIARKVPNQSARKKQFNEELAKQRLEREKSRSEAATRRVRAEATKKAAEKKINRLRKEIESYNEEGKKAEPLPATRKRLPRKWL